MEIVWNNAVPDYPVLSGSDVAPRIIDGKIHVYDGYGAKHWSWGRVNVVSMVPIRYGDFTVAFIHWADSRGRHWQWYYYIKGVRKFWHQLTPAEQRSCFDYYTERSAYMTCPGKLKPVRNVAYTCYKWVKEEIGNRVPSRRLVSLYDGKTEYVIGKRLAQRARPGHKGGYYAFESEAIAYERLGYNNVVAPNRLQVGTRIVLLKVQLSGTIVPYDNGKMAATYLTPLEELRTAEVLQRASDENTVSNILCWKLTPPDPERPSVWSGPTMPETLHPRPLPGTVEKSPLDK